MEWVDMGACVHLCKWLNEKNKNKKEARTKCSRQCSSRWHCVYISQAVAMYASTWWCWHPASTSSLGGELRRPLWAECSRSALPQKIMCFYVSRLYALWHTYIISFIETNHCTFYTIATPSYSVFTGNCRIVWVRRRPFIISWHLSLCLTWEDSFIDIWPSHLWHGLSSWPQQWHTLDHQDDHLNRPTLKCRMQTVGKEAFSVTDSQQRRKCKKKGHEYYYIIHFSKWPSLWQGIGPS